MLQISPQMRVLVAVEPIDFRRGMDGLARECRENLAEDPFRGTVFVFRNRRRTAIKNLAYDGQGFWLCQKRLSDGKFRWWPSSVSDSRVTRAEKGDRSPEKLALLQDPQRSQGCRLVYVVDLHLRSE
jgi:hypothetical protein